MSGVSPVPRPRRGALLAAVLTPFALAACGGPPPPPLPAEVACYRDAILAWVAPAYADDPATLPASPLVLFASQGEMRGSVQGLGVGAVVLGTYGMGVVTLWDRGGLGDFDTQSTLAHELAHWIDHVESRRMDHGRVYALQAAWEEAHWPDGVAC